MSQAPRYGMAARRFLGLVLRPLALGAALVGALVVLASVPTLLSLHESWSSDADYSHGHLLLVLTGILVIREVRRQPLAPLTPSWIGLAALMGLQAIVLAGHASSTLVLAQAALPALCLAAVWTTAGAANARRFAPAVGYLYLAIPVWNLLIEPMRRLTVAVVSMWIRTAGVPAFIEGNLIHVPTGTFEVEGGCAGLRYALVATTLALFMSLLHRRTIAWTMALTGMALALAFLGNWLRVFATVAAGLAPEGPVASFVHNHHTLVGWLLFVVFITPLFYVNRQLQSKVDSDSPASTASSEMRPAPVRSAVPYAACGVLAFAIWANYWIIGGGTEPSPLIAAVDAPNVSGWNRGIEWRDDRRPIFVGADQEIAAWYERDGQRVGAYVAHYRAQGQSREVVFARNLPTGQHGMVVAEGDAAVIAESGARLPFLELTVEDRQHGRRLVWMAFRVAGTVTADDLAAKILQVGGLIRGRRDAQALVLTASCAGDCEMARSTLSQYARVATEVLFERAATPARSLSMQERDSAVR